MAGMRVFYGITLFLFVALLFGGLCIAGEIVAADPFAYCAAVGTIDAPDGRYVGPKVPGPIVDGLRREFGSPDSVPQDVIERGVIWRCMDGKVWACFVGANLPCATKADPSMVPSQAMKDFCRNEPLEEGIPAYITGRSTIYEWHCSGGEPEIVRRAAEVDGQGFFSAIWYKIDGP